MRAVAGGIAELLLLRKHSAPVGATAPTGAHGAKVHMRRMLQLHGLANKVQSDIGPTMELAMKLKTVTRHHRGTMKLSKVKRTSHNRGRRRVAIDD